jgi:hypothetical protein
MTPKLVSKLFFVRLRIFKELRIKLSPGSPTRGREESGTSHPRHPPTQKQKKKKLTKSRNVKDQH